MSADYEVLADETVIDVSADVTIIQATAEEVVVKVLQSFDLVEVQTAEVVIEVIDGSLIPGPVGPPGAGGGGTVSKLASGAVGGRRIVRNVDATHVAHASALTLAHVDDVLGLSLGAAADGDSLDVMYEGDVTEPAWNWTPLETIYLGTNGALTQTVPDSPAVFSLPVGYATSANSMRVRIGTPIVI